MNTLHFEKISKFDRPAEPVTFGLPCPRGQLRDPSQFVLHDGGHAIACQPAVLTSWPDGSIKWLLVNALVNLPGNTFKDLSFSTAGTTTPMAPAPAPRVTITEDAQGFQFNNGTLAFHIPRRGFALFEKLTLETRPLFTGCRGDFTVADARGVQFTTAEGSAPEFHIEEDGPLRAVLRLAGKHGNGNRIFLDYVIRLVLWAGKPYLEVQYQFINKENTPTVEIKEISLNCRMATRPAVNVAVAEGYYGANVTRKTDQVRLSLSGDTLMEQGDEHQDDCFYGDFWGEWQGQAEGLVVTIHNAHQNFPKAIAADRQGLRISLWPEDAGPLALLQGVAKTHRLQLHFHTGDLGDDQKHARSLQFQLPDRPAIPATWYQAADVFENIFTSQIHSKIEFALTSYLDNLVLGLGMLNFGDAPGMSYMTQRRGGDRIVWLNSEYDLPHTMFLQYARTAERRFLSSGQAKAQHWIDVDICHYSQDPLRIGRMIVHTTGHVEGGYSPCHEWVEGLLDYYHLAGNRDALDAALQLGRAHAQIALTGGFDNMEGWAPRVPGWALRAIMAVYNETHDVTFKNAADRIIDSFLRWGAREGSFLSGYTSHSTIRVPFMIAVAVNSLYRYWKVFPRDEVKRLILNVTDDLLRHGRTREGLFYYKELPSLRYQVPIGLFLETAAYAYQLSEDDRYLREGMRLFEACLDVFDAQLYVATGAPRKILSSEGLIKDPFVQGPDGQVVGINLYPLWHFLVQAEKRGWLGPFEFKCDSIAPQSKGPGTRPSSQQTL